MMVATRVAGALICLCCAIGLMALADQRPDLARERSTWEARCSGRGQRASVWVGDDAVVYGRCLPAQTVKGTVKGMGPTTVPSSVVRSRQVKPPSVVKRPPSTTTTTTTMPQLRADPFLTCTRAHESDTAGGYWAVNGDQRGAYQFKQGTWDATVKRVGRFDLVGLDPAQAAPLVQDQIAFALYQWQGAAPWGGRCAGVGAAHDPGASTGASPVTPTTVIRIGNAISEVAP